MILSWKNPILHKFWSRRTILILSMISSLSEQTFISDQPIKGLRVCIFSISLPPLIPAPSIKIMFCAPSLWPKYYSLLCDSESACLSPDWAGAAEQLWKQCRSWGELWLVGEAGEIWDPPGPLPTPAHSPQNLGITWHCSALAVPLPSWGSPSWVPLFFSGTLSPDRQGLFSLIPSTSLGPLHKHSVARQPSSLLSFRISANSVQANSEERTYSWCCPPSQLSPLAPGFPARNLPASALCIWFYRLGYLSEFRDPPNSSPCY